MRQTPATVKPLGAGAIGVGILILMGGFLLAQEAPPPMPAPMLPPRQPTAAPPAASTAAPSAVPAAAPAAAPGEKAKEEVRDLDFNFVTGTPLDALLQEYERKTGRTMLISPKVPKVTVGPLRSQGKLTKEEFLEALDAVLAMNGISVIKQGERFLKVVPSGSALEEPMVIREEPEKAKVADSSELITQMIRFKHIDINEAEKTVKPLLHSGFGKVTRLDRINGILVTDTAANVKSVLQLLGHIDLPVEAREEPIVVQIRYAKAMDIKRKLEEIIAQSKEEVKKVTVAVPRPSGSPGIDRTTVAAPVPPAIPGVIRPPVQPVPATPGAVADTEDVTDLAERGIIRGKVQITADERTNKLIIITTPENMKFFEKIIKVLDVETTPDVVVKVIRLEYADAEAVASSLNTLIGGKPKDATPAPPPTKEGATPQEQVAVLRDYVAKVQQDRVKGTAQPPAGAGEALKSKVGELSADNIKLLPDKRSNSIVVMASSGDFNQIQELVKCLDIMLAQVLVEAIILEVQLGDSVQTGVDWVQRAMIAYNKGGDGLRRSALGAFTGGGGGGGGMPQNALAASAGGGAGLTYYLSYFGLNLDAVVTMASSDSGTRVLASPVIVTHDNVEATINAGEQRYFYKGQHWVLDNSTSGAGHYEPDVEQKNVGIILTVKPHINEKNLVVMDIKQTIDELAEGQKIGDTLWPTTLHREMNASVSVKSRETIVLGGLVKHNRSKVSSGIPLLHKIPLIGALFGYDKTDNTRNEVIVFLTPYVMNSPDQVEFESRRRKLSTDTAGMWKRGWSDSRLAEGGVPAAGPKEELKPEPAKADEKKIQPPPAQPAAAKERPTNVDPELLQFIERQEKQYGKDLEEAERKLMKELKETPPPSNP